MECAPLEVVCCHLQGSAAGEHRRSNGGDGAPHGRERVAGGRQLYSQTVERATGFHVTRDLRQWEERNALSEDQVR